MKTIVILLMGCLGWVNSAVGRTMQVITEFEKQQQSLYEHEITLTEKELAELANANHEEVVLGRIEKMNQETREAEYQKEGERSAPGYSKRKFNHCCHYLVDL